MSMKARIQDKVRSGMKPKYAIAKSLAESFRPTAEHLGDYLLAAREASFFDLA